MRSSRDPSPSSAVPFDDLESFPEQARRLELLEQLAEARAWARGYEHGMFVGIDTDAPPAWLTAPLELDDSG